MAVCWRARSDWSTTGICGGQRLACAAAM